VCSYQSFWALIDKTALVVYSREPTPTQVSTCIHSENLRMLQTPPRRVRICLCFVEVRFRCVGLFLFLFFVSQEMWMYAATISSLLAFVVLRVQVTWTNCT